MKNTAIERGKPQARSRALASTLTLLCVTLAVVLGFALLETPSMIFSAALVACAALVLQMLIAEMWSVETQSLYAVERPLPVRRSLPVPAGQPVRGR